MKHPNEPIVIVRPITVLYCNGTQGAQSPLTSDAKVDDWLACGTHWNLLCYKGKDNKLSAQCEQKRRLAPTG